MCVRERGFFFGGGVGGLHNAFNTTVQKKKVREKKVERKCTVVCKGEAYSTTVSDCRPIAMYNMYYAVQRVAGQIGRSSSRDSTKRKGKGAVC